MKLKLSTIDLFSGAGGLSSGLSLAGYQPIFFNELNETFGQTYLANHIGVESGIGDIAEIDPEKVRKSLSLKKGELNLIAGGPPCQGFSINAPKRSVKDPRNHLFQYFLDFIKAFEPQFIFIENVPGIISFNSGKTVKSIMAALKDLGYSTALRILYSPHFGIPQMRWRAVFLGTRHEINPLSLFPQPKHRIKGLANFTSQLNGTSLIYDVHSFDKDLTDEFVSVRSAISDLPEIPNGGGEEVLSYSNPPTSNYQKLLRNDAEKLYNHRCAGLGKANLDRLPHIPPGGSWRDIPFELLPKGMKKAKRSDHTKRYGRLDPEGIGSTILTKCDPHWGTFIHPEQDRIISVREAARLQSFRDTFIFKGNLLNQYKQVGNAVPPLLGKAIGEMLAEATKLILKGKAPKLQITKTPIQLSLSSQENFIIY
jgi:DNA (cytosine-5)-methyltransferase 1